MFAQAVPTAYAITFGNGSTFVRRDPPENATAVCLLQAHSAGAMKTFSSLERLHEQSLNECSGRADQRWTWPFGRSRVGQSGPGGAASCRPRRSSSSCWAARDQQSAGRYWSRTSASSS